MPFGIPNEDFHGGFGLPDQRNEETQTIEKTNKETLKFFDVFVSIDNSAERYKKHFHVFAKTEEDAKQHVRNHVNDPWTYVEEWIYVKEMRIYDGIVIPAWEKTY